MVKCEKSPIPPESLAIEKQKGRNGSYKKPDVVEQLAKDFSNHDSMLLKIDFFDLLIF